MAFKLVSNGFFIEEINKEQIKKYNELKGNKITNTNFTNTPLNLINSSVLEKKEKQNFIPMWIQNGEKITRGDGFLGIGGYLLKVLPQHLEQWNNSFDFEIEERKYFKNILNNQEFLYYIQYLDDSETYGRFVNVLDVTEEYSFTMKDIEITTTTIQTINDGDTEFDENNNVVENPTIIEETNKYYCYDFNVTEDFLELGENSYVEKDSKLYYKSEFIENYIIRKHILTQIPEYSEDEICIEFPNIINNYDIEGIKLNEPLSNNINQIIFPINYDLIIHENLVNSSLNNLQLLRGYGSDGFSLSSSGKELVPTVQQGNKVIYGSRSFYGTKIEDLRPFLNTYGEKWYGREAFTKSRLMTFPVDKRDKYFRNNFNFAIENTPNLQRYLVTDNSGSISYNNDIYNENIATIVNQGQVYENNIYSVSAKATKECPLLQNISIEKDILPYENIENNQIFHDYCFLSGNKKIKELAFVDSSLGRKTPKFTMKAFNTSKSSDLTKLTLMQNINFIGEEYGAFENDFSDYLERTFNFRTDQETEVVVGGNFDQYKVINNLNNTRLKILKANDDIELQLRELNYLECDNTRFYGGEKMGYNVDIGIKNFLTAKLKGYSSLGDYNFYCLTDTGAVDYNKGVLISLDISECDDENAYISAIFSNLKELSVNSLQFCGESGSIPELVNQFYDNSTTNLTIYTKRPGEILVDNDYKHETLEMLDKYSGLEYYDTEKHLNHFSSIKNTFLPRFSTVFPYLEKIDIKPEIVINEEGTKQFGYYAFDIDESCCAGLNGLKEVWLPLEFFTKKKVGNLAFVNALQKQQLIYLYIQTEDKYAEISSIQDIEELADETKIFFANNAKIFKVLIDVDCNIKKSATLGIYHNSIKFEEPLTQYINFDNSFNYQQIEDNFKTEIYKYEHIEEEGV